MYPCFVAAMLAALGFAIALVCAASKARRGTVIAASLATAASVLGIALYALTEAQYQSCISNDGIAEDSTVAVEGYRYCYRRVFDVKGDVVRTPSG